MKRFFASIIMISLLLTSLSGCKNKYKPRESTEEEARVVMTLNVGDSSYPVRYELYRAMFLTYKDEIDGGDDGVWESDTRGEYIAKMNERIVREAAKIYATLEVCTRLGYDVYSRDFEKEIKEMIEVSVEGGTYGDEYYAGFDGDYDAYLDSLAAMHHNYSTMVLLLRYDVARRRIEEHYIGESQIGEGGQLTSGSIKYTREDVERFYYSDSAAQVLLTYVPAEISYTPKELAEDIRLDVIEAAQSGDEAVKIMMINRGTPTAVSELESGILLGRYSLAREYGAIATAALNLSEGGVSEVIETFSAMDGRRYYVVYRAGKSAEYFENNYANVVEVYLYDAIGQILNAVEGELVSGVKTTEDYESIVHGDIE